MDELLKGSFDVLTDWYKIIQPRTDLAVVLKAKEESKPSKVLTEDHYKYRANLIPKRNFPYPIDDEVDNFYRSGEITYFDWNPNVALQFTTRMTGHYDKKGLIKNISAGVHILSWGTLPSGEGDLVREGLYVERKDLGWNKNGTLITISGDLADPTKTHDNITDALTMITPNVLRHREIIRGR